MNWPRTHEQLVEQGYIFTGDGVCKACRARILFYRTPNAKHIPLNPADFTSHFANCTDPRRFRTVTKKQSKPTDQEKLF